MKDLKIDFFQSNEEGTIINKIIESEKKYKCYSYKSCSLFSL